jgi:hypothetical protein
MAYELMVLNSGLHKSVDELAPQATAAIAAEGHWTRFFEVRIAARPSVKIERCPGSVEGYRVAINWGTQEATTEADSLPLSIQTADRLAKVFYDARNQASPIRR